MSLILRILMFVYSFNSPMRSHPLTFYSKVKFAPLCFAWESKKTLNFLESIEIYQLKVGTYSWLSTWINMRSSGQVRWLTALSQVTQIYFILLLFFFSFTFFSQKYKGNFKLQMISEECISICTIYTHTCPRLLRFILFYLFIIFFFFLLSFFFSQKYKGNFKLQMISEECISICTIYTHTLVTVGGGTGKS